MRRSRAKETPHTCESADCTNHVAYVVSVLKLEPDERLNSTRTRAFCTMHFLEAMPDARRVMTMALTPNPAKISRYGW